MLNGLNNKLPMLEKLSEHDYSNYIYPMADSDVKPTLDWRDINVVTSVGDQGQCGACYAFAAVGTAESALAIMGYDLIELSKQQLIECPDFNTYSLMGCYGGWYTNAWAYIRDFGLESESDYPYTSAHGIVN